jgi:hypothetical protein
MTEHPNGLGRRGHVDDHVLLWEVELDRLELGVLRAERLARGLEEVAEAEPWEPPSIAGPIPADLVERAQSLLARHDRVRAALVQALTRAQRQVAYTDKVVDITSRRPAAVYVDMEA